MKKTIIMCSVVLSGLAFADQSDNPFVYEEEPLEVTAVGDAPAAPGDPNTAPIDQYVPVLLLVGLGIAFIYGKKRIAE